MFNLKWHIFEACFRSIPCNTGCYHAINQHPQPYCSSRRWVIFDTFHHYHPDHIGCAQNLRSFPNQDIAYRQCHINESDNTEMENAWSSWLLPESIFLPCGHHNFTHSCVHWRPADYWDQCIAWPTNNRPQWLYSRSLKSGTRRLRWKIVRIEARIAHEARYCEDSQHGTGQQCSVLQTCHVMSCHDQSFLNEETSHYTTGQVIFGKPACLINILLYSYG